MNVREWILCVSKAYQKAGKEFSRNTKRLLLEKLYLENLNKDQSQKSMLRMGVASPFSPGLGGELPIDLVETGELVTHYFFRKAGRGELFGPIARLKGRFGNPRFGNPIKKNYELVGGPFVNMAKTYWTYKLEVHDLFPEDYNLVLSQVLLRVENDVASVFFPTPGPVVIWVRQRRQQQRKTLEEYAPDIDINSFLKNNPLLGTSKGRISRKVFKERILIRCQSSDCGRVLRVPNTVEALRVRCPNPKCKASFRFPARDFEWLDQVRPEAHPESHKIDELESHRRSYGIPHDLFAYRVMGSPWVFRRIQESIYRQLRAESPGASEKELLKTVFKTRVFAPPVGPITSEEEIDKAMESIDSLEDLIGYFIKEDAKEPPSPDPLGIGARVDEILSA